MRVHPASASLLLKAAFASVCVCVVVQREADSSFTLELCVWGFNLAEF